MLRHTLSFVLCLSVFAGPPLGGREGTLSGGTAIISGRGSDLAAFWDPGLNQVVILNSKGDGPLAIFTNPSDVPVDQPLRIENIFVQTVPEPRVTLLIGFAGTLIILRRRHRRRNLAGSFMR